MNALLRSRKAVGPIGAIMLFGMFLIIYFVWLSSWLDWVGSNYIQVNNAVGLEAFFYANLNLWVMLIMSLAMLGWTYFGSQG